MPELETLFVRIEADLSEFKQGMAEARRETQSFAKEARSTFSGVGTALDLAPFLKQLAASERAAIQSAERMKKAFGDVARAQEGAASQLLKTFSLSAGNQPFVIPSGGEGTSAQSSGASRKGTTTRDRVDSGLAGAAVGLGIVTLRIVLGMTPMGLAVIAATTLGGAFGPDIIDSAIGSDSNKDLSPEEQLKRLNTIIQRLEKRLEQRTKSDLISKEALENQIASFTRQRDAILQQLRASAEAAAMQQEFLRAVIDLSKCLRQLCARIDELAPASSGAAGEGGVRPDGVGFDPHASMGGGPVIPASFTGDSPFGGGGPGGLHRELVDTDWQVQDLSASFMELTQAAGGFEAQGGALAELLARSNALFGEQSGLLGALGVQVPELGESFSTFLARTSQEAGTLDDAVGVLGQGFIDAFEGAIFHAKSFRKVSRGTIEDILLLSQVLKWMPAVPGKEVTRLKTSCFCDVRHTRCLQEPTIEMAVM